MKLAFSAVMLGIVLVQSLFGEDVSKIDFHQAMQCNHSYDAEYMKENAQWNLLESLYVTYQQEQLSESKNYTIPPYIHFIWLGSPLPYRCQVMIASWKKFHPNWRIKVWTDADLKWFPMKNRAIFDQAINWGEKADIWRYEILYQYGGLYADTDYECLKPFDHFHKTCEFYCGIMHGRDPVIGSLIGARPHHPILKLCIDSIKMGPADNDDVRIQVGTGPFLFTRCFMDYIKAKRDHIVAFPTAYFFPFPNTRRSETRDRSVIKSKWILPESYALHYWDVSWEANGNEL